MTEYRVEEYVVAIREVGELKSQLADLAERLAVRAESLNAALESRAAILAIARELAAWRDRGAYECGLCGGGRSKGHLRHKAECAVSRLEAF